MRRPVHPSLRLALKIAAGALPCCFFGCGRSHPLLSHDAAPLTGTGGTVGAGAPGAAGQPGSGPVLTGGEEKIGAGGSGGTIGTGGELGTGGRPGTSDTIGAAGGPGTGGVTAGGGTLWGSGGTTSIGSATGGILVGGAASAGTSSTTGGATASGGTTDGGGAAGHPTYPAMFVGNTDTKGVVRPDFPNYWQQITPETLGTWYAVQTAADTFNWATLDALYKYSEENHLVFKEHCFVSGTSMGGWWTTLTAETAPAALQNWMKAFCDRYPKTRLIDVVNEPPPHTSPRFADAIGGGTNTTWDWIANSFKWARAGCPDAILILNDYDNCEQTTAAKHSADIVNAIKQLGAPIDAVGCQTHGASALPSSTLKWYIDLIASSTGLPVYITEYDINLADDEQQRLQYQDHFTMFMSNANVKGITVWGYIVGETWRTNTGIMHSDGSMRPAMTWLMSFLGR